MGKATRTVTQQERQIEALQSQVDEIPLGTGRFTNFKVGGILRESFSIRGQIKAVWRCKC